LTENLKIKLEKIKLDCKNKRIVFVSGKFNIIHPGHLRLLNFARSCGDFLVIGLLDDSNPEIVIDQKSRKEALSGLEAVDDVIIMDTKELGVCLRALQPYAVVKGAEYSTKENTEREILKDFGGKLFFSRGEVRFSSRDLIRKELVASQKTTMGADSLFLNKHNSSHAQLTNHINAFTNCKVLVIGELIIDEYIYCEPLGMSQEDPTIVVSPFDNKMFVGGAGIVAAHLVGLGAEATFISVVGKDETSKTGNEMITAYGVKPIFVHDTSRPTVLKQRFRAGSKTLLRVSNLRSHDVAEEQANEIFHQVLVALETADLVVFSDFNYGCLPQSLVERIMTACKRKNIPYVADSQASSQIGDVSRFEESEILSATEREVRLSVNDFKSGLQNVSLKLLEKAKAKNLLVKLGAEGLVILAKNEFIETNSLVAFNPNPVDVAGAGDALLAASSLCKLVGGSIWESAYVGSIAAALQVSRMGNIPLDRKDLILAIDN
tara:strand:+ start:59 stop:1531 length:1473 start_codon:yes stop_codon:yes gene_type:complete